MTSSAEVGGDAPDKPPDDKAQLAGFDQFVPLPTKEYSAMTSPILLKCPKTGRVVHLGPTADSMDDVQFKTLTFQNCPACNETHVLTRADLFLADDTK